MSIISEDFDEPISHEQAHRLVGTHETVVLTYLYYVGGSLAAILMANIEMIIQPLFNYAGIPYGIYKWLEFYFMTGNYANTVLGLCADGSVLKTQVPDFCNSPVK